MREKKDEQSDFRHAMPTRESVERLTDVKVLVIGDVMLDAYMIGSAERISPEAPVPVVRIESERYLLGGAGNVARNINALGGKATLMGCVGNDENAEKIFSLLEKEKIHSELVRLERRPTTVKTRIMARKQQMLRLDQEDSNPLEPKDQTRLLDLVDKQIKEHDVVIVSDYNKGLVSRDFMLELRAMLGKRGKSKMLIDPKPSNVDLYNGAYLMTPNTKETGECAGMPVRTKEEIVQAGRSIMEKCACAYLLTTLGADGMALFGDSEEIWHVPTMAREVFDVTGAGDTVIATLALGLAAKLDLLEACILSNYAAGLVVGKVGAAVISQEVLIKALEKLPRPVLERWD